MTRTTIYPVFLLLALLLIHLVFGYGQGTVFFLLINLQARIGIACIIFISRLLNILLYLLNRLSGFNTFILDLVKDLLQPCGERDHIIKSLLLLLGFNGSGNGSLLYIRSRRCAAHLRDAAFQLKISAYLFHSEKHDKIVAELLVADLLLEFSYH